MTIRFTCNKSQENMEIANHEAERLTALVSVQDGSETVGHAQWNMLAAYCPEHDAREVVQPVFNTEDDQTNYFKLPGRILKLAIDRDVPLTVDDRLEFVRNALLPVFDESRPDYRPPTK